MIIYISTIKLYYQINNLDKNMIDFAVYQNNIKNNHIHNPFVIDYVFNDSKITTDDNRYDIDIVSIRFISVHNKVNH